MRTGFTSIIGGGCLVSLYISIWKFRIYNFLKTTNKIKNRQKWRFDYFFGPSGSDLNRHDLNAYLDHRIAKPGVYQFHYTGIKYGPPYKMAGHINQLHMPQWSRFIRCKELIAKHSTPMIVTSLFFIFLYKNINY